MNRVATLAAVAVMLTSCAVTMDPVSPLPTESPLPTPTSALPIRPTPIPKQMAGDLCGQATVLWDHPALRPEWGATLRADAVVPAEWHGYVDVELRRNGEVATTRTIALQTMPSLDGPGTGVFEVVGWCWNEDEVPSGTLEEWLRLRWSAPGRDDVFGIGIVSGQVADVDERGFTLQNEFLIPFEVYLPVVGVKVPDE